MLVPSGAVRAVLVKRREEPRSSGSSRRMRLGRSRDWLPRRRHALSAEGKGRIAVRTSFANIQEDFQRFTADIVYCTVTTVDLRGRPRSRVMHPIFEVVGGRPIGWAVTDRSPIKTRHLAANPYVSC